jgi:hypothetical protein
MMIAIRFKLIGKISIWVSCNVSSGTLEEILNDIKIITFYVYKKYGVTDIFINHFINYKYYKML